MGEMTVSARSVMQAPYIFISEEEDGVELEIQEIIGPKAHQKEEPGLQLSQTKVAVLDELVDDPGYSAPVPMLNADVMMLISHHCTLEDRLTPWRLASVSRSWRQALLSSPLKSACSRCPRYLSHKTS